MKISEYIADFLVSRGVDTVFTVTGGGAMHLNDAFGHHPKLRCIYTHHEQGAALMAEGYARLSGKIPALCVTSGPGGTNAITGAYGCWVDSVPMFVISGQVKRETTIRYMKAPLRQLGDQECDIVDLVRPVTKYAAMIEDVNEVRSCLEKAWYLAHHGRKGPVWLDVPLDIQGAEAGPGEMPGFDLSDLKKTEEPVYDSSLTAEILSRLKNARRPVILAGEGIRLGGAEEEFLKTLEQLRIPAVTAWNAQDVLWEDNPCYCGIPGTVGQRAANFIVQSADLLLVLGCRMNIRIISYNRHQFAENAYKIQVDIDENELYKPTVKVDLPVHADVKDVLRELSEASPAEAGDHEKWLGWCRELSRKYDPVLPRYFETDSPMNPYAFLRILSDRLEEGEAVVCGNGASCVQTFQALQLKKGARIFTNSGCAAMGFGFPAALGAAFSRKGERVVCIDGDGSFMMNLQELETLSYHGVPLKIILLNNHGYSSIRQTQTNLFRGRELVGISPENGVGFPDFGKVAAAFGIPFQRVERLSEAAGEIEALLSADGPGMLEAVLDPDQTFEPKLSSKVHPDGTITSSVLDDMFPFLPEGEYEAVRAEALKF